jgi:hypothetical protein
MFKKMHNEPVLLTQLFSLNGGGGNKNKKSILIFFEMVLARSLFTYIIFKPQPH